MHTSYNHRNWKIFIDQSKYLKKILLYFNIVTNPTNTPLSLSYMFKPNNKQYDFSFYQKYQQLVGSLIYLIIISLHSHIRFTIVKLA